MTTLAGTYYDGRTSRAHAVTLACADGATLAIAGDGIERRDAIASVAITPRLGRTARRLSLPDGGYVSVPDDPALDAWFGARDRIEAFADRLERRWRVAAVAVAIVAVATFSLFRWGLPLAAEHVANALPASIETSMGEQVLGLLERYGLEPSTLPADRQAHLVARFEALARGSPNASRYRLLFRRAPAIGPNAFALPGGTIVVTDELIELIDGGRDADAALADGPPKADAAPTKPAAQADAEFLAVVAHEMGHQVRHHVMRHVLQSSGVVVVAAFFTGDVSSASALVVTIPTFLLQSHYSRGFEGEADDYAFDALARHGLSPRAFANVMRAFRSRHPRDDDREVAYFASHPPTASRIEAAERAADAFDAAPSRDAATPRD